jgi:Ca2+-binding EF-hand superfamily protein
MEASEVKDLEDVFNSFDSDKSGAIDLQEIKNVASALGSELTDEEMRSIIKNLDSNGDGKISFEEFKFWWEHGHKGSLGKLVYLKAKSMKLTKKWLGQL